MIMYFTLMGDRIDDLLMDKGFQPNASRDHKVTWTKGNMSVVNSCLSVKKVSVEYNGSFMVYGEQELLSKDFLTTLEQHLDRA